MSGLKPTLSSSENITLLHCAMVQCWWARAQFLRLPRFRCFSVKFLIGLLEWLPPWCNLLRTVWSEIRIPVARVKFYPICLAVDVGRLRADNWRWRSCIGVVMLGRSLRGLSFTFPVSLYFLHSLDAPLWVTFNRSATSCCFQWHLTDRQHLAVYDLLKVKPLSGSYQTVVCLYVACPCSAEHKLNEAGVDIGLLAVCVKFARLGNKHKVCQ